MITTTISCKKVNIEPDYANAKVRVELVEFEASEVEHLKEEMDLDALRDDWWDELSIQDVTNHFGEAELLDHIGRDAATDHFEIEDSV